MTNKDPNHPAATFSDRRQVGDRREQSVPIAHYDRRSYLRRSKYTQFISKPWWLLVNYLNERLTDGSN